MSVYRISTTENVQILLYSISATIVHNVRKFKVTAHNEVFLGSHIYIYYIV